MMTGVCSLDLSSAHPFAATLQGKACVTCGATKTPLWRCNVDGQKSLCNRCGVRLYREQKKAQLTEEHMIPGYDDRDESSSCTYTTSYSPRPDSQEPPVKRRRKGPQQLIVGPTAGQEEELIVLQGQMPVSLDMQPALLDDGFSPSKRMPPADLSPHSLSSDESAFLVPPPLPVEPEIVSVVVQTQRALKQAWPSLVTGPLGHLWEAGLDPLDPLFLANIQDPSPRHPDNEDGQSELALLLDPCGSLDAEHFSIF